MTEINPYRFVLVGSLEGATINLGGHQFVDGVYTLTGPEEHVFPSVEEASLKANYLAKSYQAYQENSPEHLAALERLANNQTPPGELDVAQREADDQANNFKPPVAEQPEPPVQEPPVQEPPVQEPPVQEPPVQEQPVQEQPDVAPATQSARQKQGALRSALLKLEATDDAHWTDNGLPSVAAVRQLSGDDTVSRANITELAPDLTRDKARELAAEKA